jgi:hypothetical protein
VFLFWGKEAPNVVDPLDRTVLSCCVP